MTAMTPRYARCWIALAISSVWFMPIRLDAQAVSTLADLKSLVKTGQGLVVTDATNRKSKGKFIGVVGEALVLAVPEERRFPFDTVVQVKRTDPIWNGAVIGALILGTWCAVVCGQGLDSGDQFLPAVAANAGFGALIGLGVDALAGRATLYQRPPPTVSRTRLSVPVVSFTVRF